jgi:Ser/Thr protein kinase RdoA (MazF antagonist)
MLKKGLHHMDTEASGISQSQRARARRLYEMVMTEWKRYSDTQLPQTVIHGDWHFLNSLYDEVGDIKAVLDFDFAARAERLHDVAYALWILLSQPALRTMARSFLEGYGVLTKQEEELLPTAIARAALFFVCTASFVPNPARELEVQLAKQEPFIEWACSPDGRRFITSCVPHA